MSNDAKQLEVLLLWQTQGTDTIRGSLHFTSLLQYGRLKSVQTIHFSLLLS